PVLDLDASGAGTGFTATFTEAGAVVVGSGPVAVADTDSSITDVDNANMASATITLTNPQDGAAESLSVAGALPAGITVDGTSTATMIKLVGSATKAAYQTALGQIRFNDTSNTPNTAVIRTV